MNLPAVLAVLVTAGTLALIIVRPWGVNEGVAALLGAGVVLLLRLVSLPVALRAEGSEWNVFLFFLGMMAVAALADQSGVFDAVAQAMASIARGRVSLLYLAVFVLGAGVSLLFANDTTALVLTPIVYALVVRLSLDPLPFIFATTFIADSASVGLPVSNPLNVILSDGFGLGLGAYLAHLWLPGLLVIAINIVAFFILFRRQLQGRFVASRQTVETHGLPSMAFLLAVLAVAYLVASAVRFPLGVVALAGAAAMALNLVRVGGFNRSRLAGEISWPIFAFIAGMVVIVQGLGSTGVTAQVGRLLSGGGTSPLAGIALGTIGTAIGANVINNLPMALVMVRSITALPGGGAAHPALVYSTVLGCDLGPNLTHLGSLATFLWLFFLRRKGLEVSALDYFRIGIKVTPFLLGGAILGLWLTAGR